MTFHSGLLTGGIDQQAMNTKTLMRCPSSPLNAARCDNCEMNEICSHHRVEYR